MKGLIVVAVVLASDSVSAIESYDASGLSLSIDRMEEPVFVDGVKMKIDHASGVDVPRLAVRMETRWRSEGGELLRRRHLDWRILSRWKNGRSEVIQWRESGSDFELLHSILDVLQNQVREDDPSLALPRQCTWVRTITERMRGQRHAFASALCRMAPVDLMDLLRRAVTSHEWVIRGGTSLSLELVRGNVVGSLTIVPDNGQSVSTLVWNEVTNSGGNTK